MLLRPNFLTSSIYAAEGSEVRFSAFAALVKAGVTTALLSGGLDEGETQLSVVAYAVKYGASLRRAMIPATTSSSGAQPAVLRGTSQPMNFDMNAGSNSPA